MNSYFLPENVGGIASYQVDPGDAGWYQLDVPGATLDVLPFAVPDATTGILVQALGEDLLYCLSPSEAALGTSAYLTLPAGSTIFLPGQAHVRQFCVLLNGGAPNIVVQFYTGDIGPTPQVNIPGTGSGPTPPGSGTVTSVNVNGNVDDTGFFYTGGPITNAGTFQMGGRARVDTYFITHVSPDGNDSTGLAYRLDRPFATVAAALAAVDLGSEIWVYPGSYTVNSQELNGVSIHLINAELVADFDEPYMFNCNGTVAITGEGVTALRHVGGTGTCIINGNADANITVQVSSMVNNDASIALGNTSEGAQLRIESPSIIPGPDGTAFNGWERLSVTGNIVSPFFVYGIGSGETVEHVGDITGAELVVGVNQGDFTCRGNIYGSSDNGEGCIRTNGNANVRVYGDILGVGDAMRGINVENGGADIEVYGNVSAWNQAAVDIQAQDVMSTVRVFGHVSCLNDKGVVVQLGTVSIVGSITADDECVFIGPGGDALSVVSITGDMLSTAGRCVTMSTGTVNHQGAARSTSAGAFGVFKVDGGTLNFNGTAHCENGWGLETNGGVSNMRGFIRSETNSAVYIVLAGEVNLYAECTTATGVTCVRIDGSGGGGILRVHGRVVTEDAGTFALGVGRGQGNLVEVMAGAFLQSAGTFSIGQQFSGAYDLRVYGAWTNKPSFLAIAAPGVLNEYP